MDYRYPGRAINSESSPPLLFPFYLQRYSRDCVCLICLLSHLPRLPHLHLMKESTSLTSIQLYPTIPHPNDYTTNREMHGKRTNFFCQCICLSTGNGGLIPIHTLCNRGNGWHVEDEGHCNGYTKSFLVQDFQEPTPVLLNQDLEVV